jgi:hypothetical protein
VLGEQDREIAELLERHGLPAAARTNRTRRTARRLSIEQHSRIRRLYAPDFAIYDAVSRAPGTGKDEMSEIAVPQV